MRLLDRWFGIKGTNLSSFIERDNVGTRQNTRDQADSYWSMRNMWQNLDPFVLYVFSDEAGARSALLELNCIHEAKDSGKLICTEPLIFGYYRDEGGQYEAIIAGENLLHETWQQAKEGFEKYGGWRKNDREPEKRAAPGTEKARDFSKVVFVRKYSEKRPGNPTYEEYKCDDTELAKEFLITKLVDKEQYFVIVQTPMGTWGMDIKGLYKERLLPWQTDITSVEVEGVAVGIPDPYGLEIAARGTSDNFVISVICGNCDLCWIEGLRYQNWTVIKCPKCQKRNKISSNNYICYF
jgi:hypothetical protein